MIKGDGKVLEGFKVVVVVVVVICWIGVGAGGGRAWRAARAG